MINVRFEVLIHNISTNDNHTSDMVIQYQKRGLGGVIVKLRNTSNGHLMIGKMDKWTNPKESSNLSEEWMFLRLQRMCSKRARCVRLLFVVEVSRVDILC
jgi:hypothetical protein